jgi:hypothetical protein
MEHGEWLDERQAEEYDGRLRVAMAGWRNAEARICDTLWASHCTLTLIHHFMCTEPAQPQRQRIMIYHSRRPCLSTGTLPADWSARVTDFQAVFTNRLYRLAGIYQ